MNRIKSADKILIVPDTRVDLDLMFAANSLFSTLKRNGKKVTLLIDQSNYPKFVANLVGNESFTDTNTFSSSAGYSIKIENAKIGKDGLTWKQEGENLLINISTSDTEIDPTKIQFVAEDDFELVILLGFNNPGKLGNTFMKNRHIFSPKKILTLNTIKAGEYQNYGEEDGPSISAITLSYLRENDFQLDNDELTNILAGIYWKTNNLKENIGSHKIFLVVKELLDKGADIKEAIRISSSILKLEETRLITEVLKNLRITKEGISISTVGKDISKSIKLKNILYKDWNLLPYLQDIKLSLVFVEITNRHIVYIESKTNDINALELAKPFGGKGDKNRAVIYTSELPKTIESHIQQILSNYSTDELRENREEEDKIENDTIPSGQEKNEKISDQNEDSIESTSSKPTYSNRKFVNKEEAEEEETLSDDLIQETEGDKIISPNILNPMPLIPDAHDDEIEAKAEIQQEEINIADPLQPATELPKPFKFGNEEEEKPKYQGPLPPVEEDQD